MDEPAHARTPANAGEPATLPGREPWRATLDVALVREASRAKLFGGRFRRDVCVGRYVLHERIGRGGMGVVARAHDPQLGRNLAIKLIDPDRAEESNARARFLREARALARIDHPNVVPIHDVGMADEQLWIAMEYIPGATLRRWIEARARPTAAILHVLVAAGRGLSAAHEAGLTHRDFKPDNVMVAPIEADRPSQVRVTDFGLAALAQEDTTQRAAIEQSSSEASTRSTGMGGTLGYVAPERLRGEAFGPASDQFAFCVSAWECLGGVRPFSGSPAAVCAATLETSRSALPGARAIPWWVRRVLLRGLAADPRDRFADMDLLLAALNRDPSRGPRRFALALGGLATLWWVASGPAPCEGADRALDDVWNPSRAAEIGRAFADTGVAQAEATWARAQDRVDRHARRWLQAHREACEAHARSERSSKLFDATVACLERRRAELRSALDVLAKPDAEVVRRTLGHVVVLDPVESCMRADRLVGNPEPPSPSPSSAAAVARARERLSDAEALERAGRYEEALATVVELEGSAALKGYGPIEAEIALRRGTALLDAERYDEARTALESAFFAAESAGARDVAREAATELVYCVGYRQARPDEGLTWARHARAQAELATAQERASIANAEGAVLRAKGDAEAALTRYQEAASLRAEADDAEIDVAWAASRNNIGLALADLHRWDEAIAVLREALTTRIDLLGSDHPDVADSLSNLALVLTDVGSDEEAERLLVEAIAVRERAFGPEHVSVARALINLSIVDQHLERPAVAADHLQRALGIFANALGADHLHVATTRHNLAFILGDLGRWEDALGHAEAALAIRRVRLGEDAALTLQTRAVRASTLFELARIDEAVAEQREVLRLHALAGRVDSPVAAAAHGDFGRMLARLRRHGEAIAELEIALAIETRTRGADHPKTIATAEALREARVDAADASSSVPATEP